MKDFALRLEVEDGSHTDAPGQTSHVTDVKVVLGYGDGETTGFQNVDGRPVLPFADGLSLDLIASSSGQHPEPSTCTLIPLSSKGMFADKPVFTGDDVEEAIADLVSGQYGRKAHTFLGMEAIEGAVAVLQGREERIASSIHRLAEMLLEHTARLQSTSSDAGVI
jgi:hypothetical protein